VMRKKRSILSREGSSCIGREVPENKRLF